MNRITKCDGGLDMSIACPLRDKCGRFTSTPVKGDLIFFIMPGEWEFDEKGGIDFYCAELIANDADAGTP